MLLNNIRDFMENDSKLLPELNLRVIVLGLLLSVIMGSEMFTSDLKQE